jgi:hypothetical protein
MKIYQVQKSSRIRASLRPGGARSLYFLNIITYLECQRIHPYPEYESKYFFLPGEDTNLAAERSLLGGEHHKNYCPLRSYVRKFT